MTHDPIEPEHFDPRYLVTLDELYHSHWASRKKRRISFLREAIHHFWPDGHPTRFLHITGTNGKGSVAYYLEQGLRFAGNTGSWTGPHVFDYAERFHINGKVASHDDIVAIYREKLVPYQATFAEKHHGASLSFAELGILIALHLFEQHEVVWAIMEVGAGGRYTPLMALDMEGCILTNVGGDHPKTLGVHLWQRALEKAGIARHGTPFFTSAIGDALTYVQKSAEAEGAEVQIVDDQDVVRVREHFSSRQPDFTYRNLALAALIIRHFYPGLHLSSLLESMNQRLTARFARIAPGVIVDVAHNEDKVSRLADELKLRHPGTRFHFLVGLTRSRNARDVFSALRDIAASVTVTGASYAGQDPEEVAEALRHDFPNVTAISRPVDAFSWAREQLKEDEILVLTGSAYMIDQALNPNPYIRDTNASFGRRAQSDF